MSRGQEEEASGIFKQVKAIQLQRRNQGTKSKRKKSTHTSAADITIIHVNTSYKPTACAGCFGYEEALSQEGENQNPDLHLPAVDT